MSHQLLTVDAAAEQLQLHPKTVLKMIRDGRLKASKVGRQYRILPADLNALLGVAETGAGGGLSAPSAGRAPLRVTSIVEVPDVDADLAYRISSYLPAARTGGNQTASDGDAAVNGLHLEMVHDPMAHSMKVIMIGPAGDVAALLAQLQILVEG